MKVHDTLRGKKGNAVIITLDAPKLMISLFMVFSLNIQAIANDNNPETEEIASAVTAALLESYEQAVVEREWQNELLEALRNGELTAVGVIAELPDGTACVIPPDEVVTPRSMGDEIEVVSELNSELECTSAQLESIHYAQIKEEITYASLGGTEVAVAFIPVLAKGLALVALIGCTAGLVTRGVVSIKKEIMYLDHERIQITTTGSLHPFLSALIGMVSGAIAGYQAAISAGTFPALATAFVGGYLGKIAGTAVGSFTYVTCGSITYLFSSDL